MDKGIIVSQKTQPTGKLQASFEDGELGKSWKGGYQMMESGRIEVVTKPLEQGKHAVCTTVHPKDFVAGGSRAELVWHNNDPEGSERWYHWNLYIPKDYSDTASIKDQKGRPNWQIMGQWHDQHKAGTPDTAASPPLAINYGFLSSKDPHFQKDKEKAKKLIGFDPSWDQQPVFSLTYGAPPQSVAFVAAKKGTWHKLLFHIKWSQKDDGFVELWLDGKSVTQGKIKGKNMYNELPNYFKIGLYRNPDISTKNRVCYDDIRIGKTKKDVTTP